MEGPRFSRRFAHTPESNPLWEALQSRLARGGTVFDLTRSNPTAAGIPYPSGLPSLLARPEVLRYQPMPKGLPEARRAVADYLAPRVVDPEDLLLTSSTSEAYAFLFKLLCDPGDEVLIPTPTYPLFDALAELDHVELIRYPLRRLPGPDGAALQWRADFPFLENLVSTRTRALILVNPNNPTGHIAGPAEIAGYLRLAREHDLAIIVDEVFSQYLFEGAVCPPILSDGPLVFTLNGLSKLAGLPQLKLGWIHVSGEASRVRAALSHLEWIADAYLSVNTPVQAACGDLLAQAPAIRRAITGRLEANLESALRITAGSFSRVRAMKPEAGWSLVIEINRQAGARSPSQPEAGRVGPGFGKGRPLDDGEFALGLVQRAGVYLHPGHLFGFEEVPDRIHLVASLLTPEAEFQDGLRELIRYAEAQDG